MAFAAGVLDEAMRDRIPAVKEEIAARDAEHAV